MFLAANAKKSAFQLSYQNKSCSECQQDVKKSGRETDRQNDRIAGQLKSPLLFYLTRVINDIVNGMY